jgi:hypothetical protein
MSEDTDHVVFVDFEPNDYIIRLTPFLDKKGNWTGELMVGSTTTGDNNLSDDDHYNMMQLTQLVCAAVPALEEDSYVRDLLFSIVNSSIEEDIKVAETAPVSKEVNGNVIKVNF